MARGFEVKIDLPETADLWEFLNGSAEQLERAVQRAMIKVAEWLKTHSVRELGQELGIRQDPLKERFKVFPQRGNGGVRFWVGLDPIGVYRLGQPKVTSKGVRVNKKEYERAFIQPMKSSEKLVFRRRGKERNPIDKVVENIDEIAVDVIERWERRVMFRFKELFEQEAKAVLNGYVK